MSIGEILQYLLGGLGGGGLLAWIVKWWLDKRKVKLEHRLGIVRDMTSTFHKLSFECYLPLAQAAYNLSEALKRGDRNIVSFYRLTKFMRVYMQKGQLLFLTDDRAEEIIPKVAQRISRCLRSEFLEDSEIILLEERKLDESFESFTNELANDCYLRQIFNTKYKKWINKNAKRLESLSYCYSILLFWEVTCGHEGWYAKRVYGAAIDELEKLTKSKHLQEESAAEDLCEYIKLLKKRAGLWRRIFYKMHPLIKGAAAVFRRGKQRKSC